MSLQRLNHRRYGQLLSNVAALLKAENVAGLVLVTSLLFGMNSDTQPPSPSVASQGRSSLSYSFVHLGSRSLVGEEMSGLL